MRHTSIACLLVLTACGAGAPSTPPPPDAIWTQHADNARTGAMLAQTRLSPSTVGWGSFGLLGTTVDLTGRLFPQLLYVPRLALPGIGVRNVVIATTDRGWVYYFDADAPQPDQPPLVTVQLDERIIEHFATPVIDVAAGAIFFVYKRFAERCPSRDGNTYPDADWVCGSPACDPRDRCLYSPVNYDSFCDECYELKVARLPLANPAAGAARRTFSDGVDSR